MDLYQQPGVRETVNIDHIRRHYYMTHEEINPTRIVPIGPILDLDGPTATRKSPAFKPDRELVQVLQTASKSIRFATHSNANVVRTSKKWPD